MALLLEEEQKIKGIARRRGSNSSIPPKAHPTSEFILVS